MDLSDRLDDHQGEQDLAEAGIRNRPLSLLQRHERIARQLCPDQNHEARHKEEQDLHPVPEDQRLARENIRIVTTGMGRGYDWANLRLCQSGRLRTDGTE